MTDTELAEIRFKLMQYHRGAMETRRALLFKGFLALVTFDLVLGKAATDLIKPGDESHGTKLLLTLLLLVACACFIWFAVENEAQTVKDRDKYKPLERELWNLTSADGNKTPEPRREGSWGQWGWAARGPAVFSVTLGLTIAVFCWML